MDHAIDSNKDFMHFSEYYGLLENVPIALKKSPDIPLGKKFPLEIRGR